MNELSIGQWFLISAAIWILSSWIAYYEDVIGAGVFFAMVSVVSFLAMLATGFAFLWTLV